MNILITLLICFIALIKGEITPLSNITSIWIYDNQTVVNDTVNIFGKGIVGSGPQWKYINGVGSFVVQEGESVDIMYINALKNESTIVHVHGQTPPHALDGVPFISATPIPSNRSQRVSYDLFEYNQGTYFMHSHFGGQLEDGVTAPFIVNASAPDGYPYDFTGAADHVMFLQDFCPYAYPMTYENTNCSTEAVYNILKENFYREGPPEENCPGVKPATDSDVSYKYVLANGKLANEAQVIDVNLNQPIRLRVINSGGMSNFKLIFENTTAFAVSSDGQWLKPFENNTFWISVSQRLDFYVPAFTEEGSIAIYAVTEDTRPSKQAALVIQTNGYTGGKIDISPISSEVIF